MRLINVHTLELQSFTGRPPPYAILSHRWGGNEVSYEEFISRKNKDDDSRFAKIQGCCRFVSNCCDGNVLAAVDWVWVDTCCIDKRSSAELSEAINSMAKWYSRSAYCVTYLADVPIMDHSHSEVLSAFDRSQWFLRGWTLQELLFPWQIVFCNRAWEQIGFKRPSPSHGDSYGEQCLAGRIAKITRIPESCLHNVRTMFNQSVARRMSWAARRVTTRPEDAAYCLLGIFMINMPLLYGEGSDAFIRLQQEIVRQTDDESLFAWTAGDFKWLEHRSLLANHPSQFINCGSVFRMQLLPRRPYRITNQYLEFESRAVKVAIGHANSYILELNCCDVEGSPDCIDDVHEIEAQAHACFLALHESADGTCRRIAHGGNGQDLIAHIKRRFGRADFTAVEHKTFVIALTRSWRTAAVTLKPESFSRLARLDDFFGVPNDTTHAQETTEPDAYAPSSPSIEDEQDWY